MSTADPGPPATTLLGWLRERTDAELIRLFRSRPDLALPAPVDLSTLAARAGVRSSVARALDHLDAFTLRVLEVLAAAADAEDVTGSVTIGTWFDDEDSDAVAAALHELSARLLIWPAPGRWQLVGATREVLGSFPAGLGLPAATLFAALTDAALNPLIRYLGLPPAVQPDAGREVAATVLARLEELLAGCSDAERAILDRLAAGPPIGSFRGADPRSGVRPANQAPAAAGSSTSGSSTSGSSTTSGRSGGSTDTGASPARTLLAKGLLVATDRDTVQLPREISMALRGRPAGSVAVRAPTIDTRTLPNPGVVDGSATTAVLETVRLVHLLCDDLAAVPIIPLRTGGVGVRDLKRIAKNLDIAENTVGLLLELAAESGLVGLTASADEMYLPTTDFDLWATQSTAGQWLRLAEAWLSMTRQPDLVGARDERDKTIAALSADIERHSAPGLRLQVLSLLDELEPATAPTGVDTVLEALAWRSPRRASTTRPAARSVLEEAAVLGVTGYGALPGYARTMLAGVTGGTGVSIANPAGEVARQLTAALPAPVDEFLLQPDLTVVVPGPPTAELGAELALAADLESTGGAAVYRISPASLRRALDTGRTAGDLSTFFARHSRTPVPQALQYLVNDVATQHGRLRIGVAAAYIRCDDEVVLSRLLADRSLAPLTLTRIAPTVIVSATPVPELLDRLRDAGFAPAAESAEGRIVSVVVDAPRAPARPHSRVARVRAGRPDVAQLGELVERLRASERLATAITTSTQRVAQQIPGVTSASILELLRTAVRESRTIAFSYVDDTGTPSQKVLMPISMAGGVVRGHEPDDSRLRSYALQRITTVSVLDL